MNIIMARCLVIMGTTAPFFPSGWVPPMGGDYSMNITAASDAARDAFNTGLMLSYGFDQVESRSFARTAMQADPNCAMCAWLLAYANGT